MTKSIHGLRATLAAKLRRVIGVPALEKKELAVFDIVVSRRQVVQSASMATVAGLVSAGMPPSTWGRQDPALHVNTGAGGDLGDDGITAEEQAAVNQATQLLIGTELFRETVYASPPVSQTEVNSHAVVEGARNGNGCRPT